MIANNALSAVGQRAGLYAWAGPDTIRMTRLKYGKTAAVDTGSFLGLYSRENLRHASRVLGITDMWVTYSWGFSPESEREQRTFLRNALDDFHAENIRPHAYVQGLNIVTADAPNNDVFCRNTCDKLIPYSRGRSLLCANNPMARDIIVRRVADACAEDVSGVFMDNILFGSPPIFVRSDYVPPFGCACSWCDAAYKRLTGEHIPKNGFHGKTKIAAAIALRTDAVASLLSEASGMTRSAGKEFGVNLYDPLFHTPEFYMGYALKDIDASLDYRLIENHALHDDGSIHNGHLEELIESDERPVFVVSYNRGIGRDAGYSQADVNAMFSDAAMRGYAPCLKASEYVTNGRWHALDIQALQTPTITHVQTTVERYAVQQPSHSRMRERMLGGIAARMSAAILRLLFRFEATNRFWSRSAIYLNMLRQSRRYALPAAEIR